MTRFIACIPFQAKLGKTDEMVTASGEHIHDYPFTENLHNDTINLGTGELALIWVHNRVNSFGDIIKREVRISKMTREFVEPNEDGEAFHSLLRPKVSLKE